jgi:hypothetical protein
MFAELFIASEEQMAGPHRNMFFASVTYNNDLAPFQGASAGWAVPRVETLGYNPEPLRGNKLPQILLIFAPFSTGVWSCE